jgi:hypothetical protein
VVGYGLHNMTLPLLRTDFQDHAGLASGVYELLDVVLTRHAGTVIAPMTIVELLYFEEKRGHDVWQSALLANVCALSDTRHTVRMA